MSTLKAVAFLALVLMLFTTGAAVSSAIAVPPAVPPDVAAPPA